MQKTLEYKLVIAEEPTAFEVLVNDLLLQDWQLQGGVFVSVVDGKPEYAQSLVKDKAPCQSSSPTHA